MKRSNGTHAVPVIHCLTDDEVVRLCARGVELTAPADGGRAEARTARLGGFVEARNTMSVLRCAQEPIAETVDYLRRAAPTARWALSTRAEIAGPLFDVERAAAAALRR